MKIVTRGADGKVFVHTTCASEEGEEYELYPQPSNSNQPLMFCYDCHESLGYDHNIQPTKEFP